MCDCEWPTREREDLSGKQVRSCCFSLPSSPSLCLVSVATVVYVGTQQSSLSWALYLSLLNKLGLFFLRSWNRDLCLEALSATVSLRGTGRHAVYFSNSQILSTFGYWIIRLLTRLRVSKIMPINPSYWPARLLRPTWVICGAWWRTLPGASHIKNIIWAKFKANLLALWKNENVSNYNVYLTVCLLFLPVCWNMGRKLLTHCFAPRTTGMWTGICSHACVPRMFRVAKCVASCLMVRCGWSPVLLQPTDLP